MDTSSPQWARARHVAHTRGQSSVTATPVRASGGGGAGRSPERRRRMARSASFGGGGVGSPNSPMRRSNSVVGTSASPMTSSQHVLFAPLRSASPATTHSHAGVIFSSPYTNGKAAGGDHGRQRSASSPKRSLSKQQSQPLVHTFDFNTSPSASPSSPPVRSRRNPSTDSLSLRSPVSSPLRSPILVGGVPVPNSPMRSPSAYTSTGSVGGTSKEWLSPDWAGHAHHHQHGANPVSSSPQGRYTPARTSWAASLYNTSPYAQPAAPPLPARISKVAPLAPYLPTKEGLAAVAAMERRAAAAQRKLLRNPAPLEALPPVDPSEPTPAQALQAQQLLAHLCMSVNSAPSGYLEQLVRRVSEIDSGIMALGDKPAAEWSTPAMLLATETANAANISIPGNTSTAKGKHNRARERAKQQGSSGKNGPLLDPLEPYEPEKPPPEEEFLNIQALASLLTPSQSANLHLYPQLLVQAYAAALAAALAHAQQALLPPAQQALVGFQTNRTAGGTKLAGQRRRRGRREWDDYFGSKLVLLMLHGGFSKPKAIGTFGTPPPLLPSVLSVEKQQQKEARARAAKAAAKQRERDRAFESLERARAVLPAPDFHASKDERIRQKEVQLVRAHLERLAPMSPAHHKRLLFEQQQRDAWVSGYNTSSAGAVSAEASAALDVEHPIPESQQPEEELPLPPSELPSLNPDFIDANLYADQETAKAHLLHLSVYCNAALAMLMPSDPAAGWAPWMTFHPAVPGAPPIPGPKPEWDSSPAVAQALLPFLSYFEGSRVQYALPPPNKVETNSSFFLPSHRNGPMSMYTSGASGTLKVGKEGSVAADMRLEAALWPEDEIDMLVQTQLQQHRWFLPGFRAAQRTEHPDDIVEDGDTDNDGGTPVVSEAGKPPVKARVPPASLKIDLLAPDATKFAVSTSAGFAPAAPVVRQGVEVGLFDPGAALPPPPASALPVPRPGSAPFVRKGAAPSIEREKVDLASLAALVPPQPVSSADSETEPRPVPPPPPAPAQLPVLDDAMDDLFPTRLDTTAAPPTSLLPPEQVAQGNLSHKGALQVLVSQLMAADPNAASSAHSRTVSRIGGGEPARGAPGSRPTSGPAGASGAAARNRTASVDGTTPRGFVAPAGHNSVPATPAQRAALFGFARAGALEEVAALLSQGVSVSVLETDDESTDSGDQLAHVACRLNDKRLLKLCLKAGADMHAVNRAGDTPMHVCTASGFQELARYLQSKGADPTIRNAKGQLAAEGSPALLPVPSP